MGVVWMEIVFNDFDKTYDLLRDKLSWDYIDPLKFKIKTLEQFFGGIYLDVTGKPKCDFVEDKLNPPSFVCYFYYFIFLFKRVPTQQEYIGFYYSVNSFWIGKNVGSKYDEAFKGRLDRFYPSMLRDIHFYHLLKESQLFQMVLYVLEYDLDSKIDVFVKKEEQWYGIQLRTNTYRSQKYFNKKPNRNMVRLNAKLIDVPINLGSANSIPTRGDDFKIYSKVHIDRIINEITYFNRKGDIS
jgi:hypothetical protein